MFRLSNETEPVIDSWKGVADVPRKPWVGVTYFFGKGSKQLDKIAMLKPQTKVHVTLRDGTVVHADPAELRLASHKKVHHFDLHTAQHPDLRRHARHFDLPRSRRKGRFEIPFGEFGSEQNKNSNSPGDRPHASRLGVILEQPATVAMPRLGSDGVGAEGPDPPGAGHGGAHRDDAARQAPGPLHHGGIGGNGPRGARARADASDDASSDDDSAGSDQKGPRGDTTPRSNNVGITQTWRGARATTTASSWSAWRAERCGKRYPTRCPTRRRRFRCMWWSTATGTQDRQEGHRTGNRGPLSKLAGLLLVAAASLLAARSKTPSQAPRPRASSSKRKVKESSDLAPINEKVGGADGGGWQGAGLGGLGGDRPSEAQAGRVRADPEAGGPAPGKTDDSSTLAKLVSTRRRPTTGTRNRPVRQSSRWLWKHRWRRGKHPTRRTPRRTEADTVSISSGSFSEVAPVTDND